MSWKIHLATNEAHHANDLDAAIGEEHPKANWSEWEQMKLARNLASQAVVSGAIGSNGEFEIELAGSSNGNHEAGESLSISVACKTAKKAPVAVAKPAPKKKAPAKKKAKAKS